MKLLEIIKETDVEEYKDNLLKLKLDDETFYKSISSGMIDLFPHVLTLEEMEEHSFEFKDLNLRNEYKYMQLFEVLYKRNSLSELIVLFDYKTLEDYEHLNIIEELDRYEKHLWVNQMIHLNKDEVTDYFLVKDLELLKMLVQINIRERAFMEFHFEALDVVLRGSFDCSMSIFSRNSDSIENLRSLVEQCGLFIRSFEIGEDT